MYYLQLIGVIVLGYFLGNINFALIISKLTKRDIRKESTGNPGAMNMFRSYGKKLGAMTLLLDAFKGASAALLGWLILGERLGMFIGGVSAIIGHVYPVFLKFKGGKGIATTIGVCLVISPIAALIGCVAGFMFINITNMGAVTSFIIITPPLSYCGYVWSQQGGNNAIIVPSIILFIFLLTLFKHRTNVKRLFSGTENKTALFKKKH